ncbi:SH3 domain-containing YSC84 1 [Hyphodiscus hymeniophilus]|uniref:SH3 domain-containing YSC84 1 n=1 Tax=Hyphodiscus hymeniophilus TaxID=353542 RepID=A0A9P7AXZ6_9HELO|nr:SH3 domain-containing YSC84 1 [Hyphodiscus hymeniophilus]
MGFFKASGLGKECDKAAQILKSFIDKGKIPKQAIANAYGVAIFTGFRAGMYLAGGGGSGVVIARLSDGSWSPPSAFSVRSGSFGLVYGVDVYDCVCVLNTQDAVDAYTVSEVSLGGAVALAAGPMSIPTQMKDVKPVWVYTKSRGFYGGVTVDGTVISQRPEMNAEFYGAKLSSGQILKGNVTAQNGATKWPAGATKLTETLKLAEGKQADSTVLQDISNEPTPGDLQE